MRTPLILLVAIFAALISATTLKAHHHPKNFFLVTTTQLNRTHNSTHLANASATSLFDPFDQQAYLLRLIAPGYNSLPTFNLTHGVLHTLASGILGFGTYEYNSTEVKKGGELQFLPSNQRKGKLELYDGYLLTVAGKRKGWTICDGDLEQEIISWKGNDTSCRPTYIHAVKHAPY